MKYFLIDHVYDPLERKIVNWLYADAKWYEFWMPGSGWSGGCINGMIVFLIVFLIAQLV